jgi:hypothetical protein
MSQQIRLFNDVEPQPPTCISDFSLDYLCHQGKELRKSVFIRTGGFFTANVAEPDPFMFYTENDYASTKLPIRFVVRLPQIENSGNDPALPGAFDALVTWQLRSLTFVSVRAMKSMPTEFQMRRPSSTRMITSSGQSYRLKMTLNRWNECPNRTNTHEQQGSTTWAEEVELPLMLSGAVLPTPPLFTPYISRRYSLLVQIKVANKTNGKTSVWLEVPVQMVYQCKKIGVRPCGLPPPYNCSEGSEHVQQTLEDDLAPESPIYVP